MLNDRGMGATKAPRGFTLIELLVVVTVAAVSMGLAAPAFAELVANYRVRSGADSLINGLNYARAEAVRRNTNVRFSLIGGGSGWTVTQVSDGAVLQTRSNNDSPGLSAVSGNASTAVTFIPTGLVQSGAQLGEITVAGPNGGTEARRINIFGGGLIRMCDPGVSTDNDPRRC